MFKKGYRKTLEVDDLYNPISSDRRVILVIMDIFVRLSQPLMLGNLLAYFKPGTTVTKTEALWYAGAVVGLNAISALFINQYIMGAFHYGMKVRAACCALVYRKALRLSKTALGETASGKMVNLLSNDVSRFDIVSIFIHHMWVAPTAAIIVTYFLYAEAGYAGILGILPVFLVVPVQGYTGKLSAIYRKQTALKTDERVRLMDEVISGVQVIKMYAWEKPFDKIIKFARKAEIKIITKSSYVRALFMTFNLFTTRVALFCTLLTMALSDQPITAAKVFVFMTYFNILSQTMSSMFVRGISEVAELFVAIWRLQEFMLNEEYQPVANIQNNNDSIYILNKNAVGLRNLTAKWNISSSDNALQNINFNVSRGKLVGIIGPVGSGKSSLLQTILGELEVISGTIEINGSLSYASQEAWVFAATIRQNILFGAEYDKKRYSEVVHACALEKDFKQFPDGDQTVVGDRGASLSARAVYRDVDIYLLDDPLSAVDVHVSKHLYDECINGYLANKTRILVTHQVHHLKNVDNIYILNNGIIENEGTFRELSASDNFYAKLLTSEPEPTEEEKLKPAEASKVLRKLSIRSTRSLMPAVSELSIPESLLQEDVPDEEDEDIKLKDMQEDSSKGTVHGSLFWKYMFAGGNICFVTIVIVLYALSQIMASGVDYFVSFWVNVEEFRNVSVLTNGTDEVTVKPIVDWSTETCLYIYGGGVFGLFFVALLRSMLFYKLAMKSSQKLHNTMFSNIIGASMRFFDTNPSGRILNRFSKDMGAIDELLPKAILDAGQILLMMAGSVILVAVVNPQFLILVGIVGIFFLLLRHVFLKTSKNIKRLEGIMRSPVFTHLNATLQGLTTIRAFGAQDILRNEFDKHQDCHTSAWFMYIAASSAFGFWLDILCFIFVGIITFSFLTFALGLDGGKVGLAITQAAALTGIVQWGLRQSAEVANQLMSVERVLEYTNLPQETQPQNPVKPPC
ncbi:hypothetical protein NQ318_003763 [Aromia moschata]|uniref:Uncharacterized protein n=1 Tax=Aromia moschata TaxID=1265417 RepID=A0AAV8YK76_9CUCU|nr:hypothetical protein NQ318_003763 [Aromia moschata]